MIILNRSEIEKVYNMDMAIKSAEKSIITNAEIPLRINFDIPEKNGQVLYMPAYLKEQGITGLKIVSVFPDNSKVGLPVIPAQIILMNPDTGETMCMVDGTYVTQLRTAAIQGLATKLLSNKNSKYGLIIGAGGQSFFQAEAMARVRSLEVIYIFDNNIEKSKKIANLLKEELKDLNTEYIPISDINEVISKVDIITSVTTSKTPTFDGSKVKKGVHVNGVGSYTKEMIEVPSNYIEKVNKVFMDSEEGVMSEAGDVLEAINLGKLDTNSCFEIGEVIKGKVTGRDTADEYTFFKTVGTAVLDIVTGWDIFQKYQDENK